MHLRRSLRSLGIDPEEERRVANMKRESQLKLKKRKEEGKFLRDLEIAIEAKEQLELEKLRVQELEKAKQKAREEAERLERAQEVERLKELEKAKEVERLKELEKAKEAERLKELEKAKEAEQLKELEKAKEAERLKELEKAKEVERLKELERAKEVERLEKAREEADRLQELEKAQEEKVREERELETNREEDDLPDTASEEQEPDRIEIETSEEEDTGEDRKHQEPPKQMKRPRNRKAEWPPDKKKRRKTPRKKKILIDVEKPDLWVDSSIQRSQSEEEFEIDKIVAHTGLNYIDHPEAVDTRSYLIRWAGSNESGDSWEDAKEIEAHNFEIVGKYWDRSHSQQLWITGKGKSGQFIDVYEVDGSNQRFLKCIPNPGFSATQMTPKAVVIDSIAPLYKQLAPHCKAPRSVIETHTKTVSRSRVIHPDDSEDEPLFKKISSHQLKELQEVLQTLGTAQNTLRRIVSRFI